MGTKTQSRTTAVKTKSSADHEGFSLISNQKLLALYEGLRKVTQPRTSASTGDRDKICFLGREAGAVAACIDMQRGDRLSVLWRGEMLTIEPSLEGIVQFAPKPTRGGSDAKTAAMPRKSKSGRESDIAVERTLGASLMLKAENKGGIYVALMLEGRNEDWADALKIAAAHNLPLIFVRQGADGAAGLARASGDGSAQRRSKTSGAADEPYLPFIPVDSNDVVAIYRVAYEAIGRARKGRGPTVIECQPYRVQGGSVRSKGASDPVASMELYLAGKGLLPSKDKTKLRRKRLTKE